MNKTSIEWTDYSWNPLRGCSRISEGCRYCHAENMARRFCGPGLPYEGLINTETGRWNNQIRFLESELKKPMLKTKPRRIFVCSMSDLFHDAVSQSVLDQIFSVIATRSFIDPQHTFQILTKRSARMQAYMCDKETPRRITQIVYGEEDDLPLEMLQIKWPLPNVWLGVSAEDQKTADERIPHLLACPAVIHWVSAEPLLGPIDFRYIQAPNYYAGPEHIFTDLKFDSLQPDSYYSYIDKGVKIYIEGAHRPYSLDWIVCGGESGSKARPMHPEWARSLRDQCQIAGIPFMFKQWGEWGPWNEKWRGLSLSEIPRQITVHPSGRFTNGWPHDDWLPMIKWGKKTNGRLLDDILHDEYPVVARRVE